MTPDSLPPKSIVVNVGSANAAKLHAAESAVRKYFPDARIVSKPVESGVPPQPFSLHEMVGGAKNRAKRAWTPECTYAIGLEAGLMRCPGTRTGFLDANACAIFDGKNYYLGLSPGFEYPPSVLHFLRRGGKEVKEFFKKLTGDERVHETTGAVGVLSKGVFTRPHLIEDAVLMALLPLVSTEHYRTSPPSPVAASGKRKKVREMLS